MTYTFIPKTPEELRSLYPREPQGTWVQGTKIWTPTEDEIRPCCLRYLRRLSIARPQSLLQHCRSIEHTARYYQVSTKALRAALKKTF